MVGIMWKWFIDADVGLLNGFLYQFGLIDDYIPFLANPPAPSSSRSSPRSGGRRR